MCIAVPKCKPGHVRWLSFAGTQPGKTVNAGTRCHCRGELPISLSLCRAAAVLLSTLPSPRCVVPFVAQPWSDVLSFHMKFDRVRSGWQNAVEPSGTPRHP